MNKSIKEILLPTAALTAVTLVVSAALVFTYNATKKEQVGDLSDTTLTACQALFPESENFETVEVDGLDEQIQNVVLPDGSDAIGFEMELKGYSKGLVLVVGIDANGSVIGYEVAESSETPGLGTQITEDDFRSQFTGKTAAVTGVKGDPKSDTEVSVISGATLSSNAVINGVNLALESYPAAKEAAANE